MTFQPFSALDQAAVANPTGLFYADSEQTLTFSEARGLAVQFAGQLRLMGVNRGDTVAIDLPTGMQVLFTFAALHLAAASATVTESNSPDGVMWDWWLTSTGVRTGLARNVLIIDNEFLIRAAGLGSTLVATEFSDADTCRIALTSGTTGRPKAIALTPPMADYRAAEAAKLFVSGGPFLCTLGLATTSGFHTLLASAQAGLPYLAPGNGPTNRDTIRRHAVTSIKSSPQQIADIVNASAGIRLDSLRAVNSAGGKVSRALVDGVRAISDASVTNLYGSSEAGRAAEHVFGQSVIPDLAGNVVEGCMLEVVDESGERLSAGSTGEIRYKSLHMATGYLGDEATSSDSFRDGWFYPGDIGRIETDGSLYLVGRTTDTLNAGGVKIDPLEFEEFATSLPGVTEALGFTHVNDLGVAQFVLAVAGQGLDITVVSAELEKRFGRSRPSSIFAVPVIPRTDTGKTSRRLTAELYADAISRATN